MNSTINRPKKTNSHQQATPQIAQNLSFSLPTLVFIDSGIEDYELLVEGILPTAQAIVLSKHKDGIAQISEVLKSCPTANIQLIAHGSPGGLQLGSKQLNLDNIHTYRQQLQQWQAAEILIYGCEVAAYERGEAFIEKLHQFTRANIAASARKIGNAQHGGSWELEVKVGKIAANLALKPEVRGTYPGVLVTFSTATNFSVSTRPILGAVGDFNKDGYPDLAVTNFGSNNVSVLLGLSTGSFATATNFSVGTYPASVAVGDFNKDGYQDLAVANEGSSNVSVLLGLSTGGFGTATNFSVGMGPFSVAVGDFNKDGYPDLAVANYFSANVSVLLGLSTGGFATATNFSVGTNPRSVAVGDFNKDGYQDLAVANQNSNNVSVLLGLSTGGFATATNFSVGTGPFSVAVEDLNKDGYQDLAVANQNSNNVSVLLGLSTGGFATATNFSVGTNPRSVAVGDFNKDGYQDLAVANHGSNNVSVLLGLSTGGFGTATNFSVGTSPFSATVGDFNGDGKQDLAVANESDNNVSVLLNTTPPTITLAPGSNPTKGGPDGNFTVTLDSAAPVGGLVVNFNTNGSTATQGTDYTLAAGTNITNVTANTFTIAAGQTSAALTVKTAPNNYTVSNPNETVTLNLAASNDYILGTNNTTTLTVANHTDIAPVLTVPGNQTVNENTSLNLTGISISDFDTGTSPVQLTLSATNGNLTFNSTTGLTLTNGSNGTNNIAFTGSLSDFNNDLSTLVYQGNSSFSGNDTITLVVNDLGNTGTGGPLTNTQTIPVIVNPITPTPNPITPTPNPITPTPNPITPIPASLTNISDDVFNINGDNGLQTIQISITSSSSNLVDELGVYTVDDAAGTIGGIAPGAAGYTQAALARGQVILSALANLPQGFTNSSVNDLLQFSSNTNLRFYLVKNSTTENVLAGVTPTTDVLFSDPSNQKITSLGNNAFSLAWKDSSGNNTTGNPNLDVKIQLTNNPLPLGTDLQGSPQGELIDLHNVQQQVNATFVVNREAAYNNYGGFYQVINANGDINANGTVLHPGDSGYLQAAVAQRILSIDLTVDNQGQATYTSTFQPGAIFAPFLIADGTPDAFLHGNSNNAPHVFTSFLGANTDKQDHVRLLGNNVFAFEDQLGGGDKDFNDLIMRITFSTPAT
ncbi:MAG: FG-GAP-like repeat-containing protein [Nostoc sp.]|uniref:FG-GAP-like repeat-containing protein n=1 Tax=Nostoc sp. TaxID=1180 RepID=UPI002FFD566D